MPCSLSLEAFLLVALELVATPFKLSSILRRAVELFNSGDVVICNEVSATTGSCQTGDWYMDDRSWKAPSGSSFLWMRWLNPSTNDCVEGCVCVTSGTVAE